jgi:plasmid stability protein
MPVLHLTNVPPEVYEALARRAAAHRTTAEAEALDVLQRNLTGGAASQADLLEELRRRSFTPPPGTPDSVELLREDRAR